ncbi:MAG: thioesterase family protein [Flavobacteriaceae bacterium]|nr:thioesterase family protein [Flavobacteriaceae bacterium]
MYKFTTKWADFDPNKHMRHSAYNDFAAEARIRFFNEHGIDMNYFTEHQIGPILFKEVTTFLREINSGEDIKVSIALKGVSKNGERWIISHQLYKENGVKAAQIEVYGAWIDINTRNLTSPPESMIGILTSLQKTTDFEIILLKNE